jgi:hypothetical protein
MKKSYFLFILFTSVVFSQGKLAAEYNNLIGKNYFTEVDIPELKTFVYDQGVVIGNPNENPLFFTLDVFKKDDLAIVLLSKKVSLNPDEYKIIDVLKLASIPKNHEIRTYDCTRKGGNLDETIISVVDSGTKIKVKKVTAAFTLTDNCFEKIPIKTVECLNQGID